MKYLIIVIVIVAFVLIGYNIFIKDPKDRKNYLNKVDPLTHKPQWLIDAQKNANAMPLQQQFKKA